MMSANKQHPLLAWAACLALVSGGCSDDATQAEGSGSTSVGDDAGSESDASSDGQAEEESGSQACEIPSYPDDIVLGDAEPLDGAADRMAAMGDRAVICGDGFVALRTASGTQTTTDPSLAGVCAGIAFTQDERIVVAHRSGQVTLLRVDADTPQIVGQTQTAGTLHDVAAEGNVVWVAAGSQGVLSFAVEADGFTVPQPLAGATDARGLSVVEGRLLVADGYTAGEAGAAHIRLLDTGGGGVVAELEQSLAVATRVVVSQGRAVVLVPGAGFAVVEVGADSLTLAYTTHVEHGHPVDVAFQGDTLLLASVSHLQRYALGDSEASPVSVQLRSGADSLSATGIRSVARLGEQWLAVAGDTLVEVELGDGIPAPEIAVDSSTFSLFESEAEALFPFRNIGTEDLIYTSASAESPFSAEPYAELATEVEGCPGQYIVEPGSTGLSWVRYEGDDESHAGSIVVTSNDADQSEFEGQIEINRVVPAVGTAVEDFVMPTVDGDRFRLSDHLGKVVLVKLYNPL